MHPLEQLVECVPNVSEGADAAVLGALAKAAASRGTWLLDRSADLDHGRAVYSLAGAPASIADAIEAMVAVAVERIDMRSHRGRHPCIGSVDVIPFVPLGVVSMNECVAGARAFAQRIADRFELPVYLYGEAATAVGRRTLAQLRRPGFDGLAEAMAEPAGAPDFGPGAPHPTAGATAVGARPFLIAFNLGLATPDVSVARRIAARIRARDGGLPGLQALGIELASRDQAQLSMNVLDHARTPLWLVREEAERLARDEGTKVLDAELVGLAPISALLAVADHIGSAPARAVEGRLRDAGRWLRIRGFDPDMAFELRLQRVRGRSGPLTAWSER